MDQRPALGRAGEEETARHLARLGYEILDRNYRCRYGEIDLVARSGSTIAFVEVKTRGTDHFGLPAEAVRYPKQLRIRRSAALWLDEHRPGRCTIRFDVASVIVRDDELDVALIEAAF